MEVNKTGILVGALALILYLRNVFFSAYVIDLYPQYPFRMNSNFMRCSNSYFSAKGKKPLHRVLFFNLVRCMAPELLKELIFKGKVVIWEFTFVFCCTVTYTLVLHFLPLSIWRRFRFMWAWMLMEYYTKHASDLIDSRNNLENLASHNFCAFWLFNYLETNSNLTANLAEGLIQGVLTLRDVPYEIYDGLYNYVWGIPACYILQILLLGADLQLYLPSTSIGGLWWQKRHLAGWVQVDLRSTEYDAQWLYCAIITFIFVLLSGKMDVYRKIKWLEDYKPEITGAVQVNSSEATQHKGKEGKAEKQQSESPVSTQSSSSPSATKRGKKSAAKNKKNVSKKVKND